MSITKCGQEKLTLKSIRYIDGQSRVNIASFQKFDDGSMMIYLDNGKNKETGKNKTCSILINKEDIGELFKWIAKP